MPDRITPEMISAITGQSSAPAPLADAPEASGFVMPPAPRPLAPLSPSAPAKLPEYQLTPEDVSGVMGSIIQERTQKEQEQSLARQAELDARKAAQAKRYGNFAGRALVRGAQNTMGGLAGFGALAGELTGIDSLRDAGLAGAKAWQDKASEIPGVQFKEITGPVSAGKWALEKALENAPFMLGTMGAAGVGAKLASKIIPKVAGEYLEKQAVAKIGSAALKGMAPEAQEKVIGVAANGIASQLARKYGARAGVVGATAALESGGDYPELVERGLGSDKAALSTLATGIGKGFIETMGGDIRIIDRIMGAETGGIARRAIDRINKSLTLGKAPDPANYGVIKRIFGEAARIGREEGLEEVLQEGLALANIGYNDPTFKVFAAENLPRILEAGAGGFAVGALMGGPSGMLTSRENYARSRGWVPPSNNGGGSGELDPAIVPPIAPADIPATPPAEEPSVSAPIKIKGATPVLLTALLDENLPVITEAHATAIAGAAKDDASLQSLAVEYLSRTGDATPELAVNFVKAVKAQAPKGEEVTPGIVSLSEQMARYATDRQVGISEQLAALPATETKRKSELEAEQKRWSQWHRRTDLKEEAIVNSGPKEETLFTAPANAAIPPVEAVSPVESANILPAPEPANLGEITAPEQGAETAIPDAPPLLPTSMSAPNPEIVVPQEPERSVLPEANQVPDVTKMVEPPVATETSVAPAIPDAETSVADAGQTIPESPAIPAPEAAPKPEAPSLILPEGVTARKKASIETAVPAIFQKANTPSDAMKAIQGRYPNPDSDPAHRLAHDLAKERMQSEPAVIGKRAIQGKQVNILKYPDGRLELRSTKKNKTGKFDYQRPYSAEEHKAFQKQSEASRKALDSRGGNLFRPEQEEFYPVTAALAGKGVDPKYRGEMEPHLKSLRIGKNLIGSKSAFNPKEIISIDKLIPRLNQVMNDTYGLGENYFKTPNDVLVALSNESTDLANGRETYPRSMNRNSAEYGQDKPQYTDEEVKAQERDQDEYDRLARLDYTPEEILDIQNGHPEDPDYARRLIEQGEREGVQGADEEIRRLAQGKGVDPDLFFDFSDKEDAAKPAPAAPVPKSAKNPDLTTAITDLTDSATGETIPAGTPHYVLNDGRIFSEESYAQLKDVGAQEGLFAPGEVKETPVAPKPKVAPQAKESAPAEDKQTSFMNGATGLTGQTDAFDEPAPTSKPTTLLSPGAARNLLSLPRESQVYPMGKEHHTLRRQVLEELTGAEVKMGQAGANAVREALYQAAGVMEGTVAAKDDKVREWLKGIVENGEVGVAAEEDESPQEEESPTHARLIELAHRRFEENARVSADKANAWAQEVERKTGQPAGKPAEPEQLPIALSINRSIEYIEKYWPDLFVALKTKSAVRRAIETALNPTDSGSFKVEYNAGLKTPSGRGTRAIEYDKYSREQIDNWAASEMESGPRYSGAPVSSTPQSSGLTLADIRKIFPKGAAQQSKDGNFTVVVGGKRVSIQNVEFITPNEAAFELGYGQSSAGMTVKGETNNLSIRISKFGDIWTLAHESFHVLTNLGLITERDTAVLNGAIAQKERKPLGKVTEEDRAAFVEEGLKARDAARTGVLGRIIQKVADFVDSLANLFQRTHRGVLKDLESGKVAEREGKGRGEGGAKYQIDAWHGSPHQFDRFTTEKIGTGEGHQAFGWGLYYTSLKDIAKSYVDSIGTKDQKALLEAYFKPGNIVPAYGANKDKVVDFQWNDGHWKVKVQEINSRGEDIYPARWHSTFPQAKEIRQVLGSLGNVYQVTLHKGKDPGEYSYLEWDKPIAGQSKDILDKLDDVIDYWQTHNGVDIRNATGRNLYDYVSVWKGSPKDASLYLLSEGIDGIKYKAGTLSGAVSDAYNYVVFDENAVTIERATRYSAERLPATATRAEISDDHDLYAAHYFKNIDKTLKSFFVGLDKGWAPGTKQDLSEKLRILSLPIQYTKVVPALNRAWKAWNNKQRYQHENENEIFRWMEGKDGAVITHTPLKDLGDFYDKHKGEVKAFARYIFDRDLNRRGWKVVRTGGGKGKATGEPLPVFYEIRTPDDQFVFGTKTQLTDTTAGGEERLKDKLWARAYVLEAGRSGLSEAGQQALVNYRTIADLELKFQQEGIREAIRIHQKAGKPVPKVSAGYDESGKEIKISLAAAMDKMGELRGFYMPRLREQGSMYLFAKKDGVNSYLQFFDSKRLMNAKHDDLVAKGFKVTKGEMKGVGPDVLSRIQSMVAVEDMLGAVIGDMQGDLPDSALGIAHWKSDLSVNEADPKQTVLRVTGTFDDAQREILQSYSGVAPANPNKNGSETWEFRTSEKNVRLYAPNSGTQTQIKKELLEYQNITADATLTFARILTEQVAETLQARGAMARHIGRDGAKGKEVVLGYEQDPLRAITLAGKGIAASAAKHRVSMEMYKAKNGTDQYTWESWKAEKGKGAKWKEFRDYVNERRIDPVQQKKAVADWNSMLAELMRTPGNLDTVMGTFRGIASLMYLSFRLPAALINLTTLGTSGPAAISGETGIPLGRAFHLIAQQAPAYLVYLQGKAPQADKIVFDRILAEGWADAQFNQEAVAVLKNKLGRSYDSLIDTGMWMFGKAERMNRIGIIAAAYRALQEKHDIPRDRLDFQLLEQAKEISDAANGDYSGSNMPAWMRGNDVFSQGPRSFYVFKTYAHSYLVEMTKLFFAGGVLNAKGWSGENRNAKLAALWMATAGSLFGGVGSSVLFSGVIAGLNLFRDDDAAEDLYAWILSHFGETGERFARFGAAGVAGVNIKSSIAINLFNFDDYPSNLPELLGAPASVVTNYWQGASDIKHGDVMKGFEKLLPNAFSAPVKAWRESTEGVTGKSNAPLFWGDEKVRLSRTEAVLRTFAFQPVGPAEKREIQWSEKKIEREFEERRTEINKRIRAYYVQSPEKRDEAEWLNILERIEKFNEKALKTGNRAIRPITRRGMRAAMRSTARAPWQEKAKERAEENTES